MLRIREIFGASKEKLIEQMGSTDNKVALDANTKLRDRNHMKDGSLRGVNLIGANLQKALFAKADMEGANLQGANLRDTYFGATKLSKANLQGADLQGANMREVILIEANLSNTSLQLAHIASARLQRANLQGANLKAANLWGSNLQDATLEGAQFDENTVLPDGTRWTPTDDVTRFSDPKHPQFWRSDNRHSPAHK